MPTDPALENARLQKQGCYQPRSRHLTETGEPRFTNRLILEDSPYLLQHAHNPVDWYAWGDEAFAAARRDNKPVFLSIGYATCHWCHVMEEESFDDLAVAKALNSHFISIKVDREQRPDLDDFFMIGVQLLSGQGGWPMSSFLTPEGKPFFGATYLPKADFLHLLRQIGDVWCQRPQVVIDSSEKVYQAIVAQCDYRGAAAHLDDAVFQQAVEQLLALEDKVHGGIGNAPKFPGEPNLLLLLDQVQRAGLKATEHPAWSFIRRALDGMLQGGIYDQVGGGFHRYATDAAWRIPHFEKMLYNQAQLALIYTRAWGLGGEPEYHRIATETLDYTLAEMRSPSGGFYSATDADSEGVEGKFFTWRFDELASLFAPDELDFLTALYGLSAAGHFEGANILHLPVPLQQQVPALASDYAGLLNKLRPLRKTLYQVRQQRPKPLRDDKEITEWNGMMIIALAEAGRVFARQEYLDAATACAESIWQRNRTPGGTLYRNLIQGRPSIAATLADYGYYLQALIALYDATGEPVWLARARQLHQRLTEHYWDDRQGGFFNTAPVAEGPALVRSKAAMDNTAASGNSAVLLALVLLRQRTGDPALETQIVRTEAYYSSRIIQQPLAFTAMLAALAMHRQALPATLQYAAGGKVRMQAKRDADDSISVQLQIAEGWHINGPGALQKELVATELSVADPLPPFEQIHYPPALEKVLGFEQHPLSLYEGEVSLQARLRPEARGKRLLLVLRLQACNDRACLPPETVQLLLPLRPPDQLLT